MVSFLLPKPALMRYHSSPPGCGGTRPSFKVRGGPCPPKVTYGCCGQLEGPSIALGKTGLGHLILNLNFLTCKMGLL